MSVANWLPYALALRGRWDEVAGGDRAMSPALDRGRASDRWLRAHRLHRRARGRSGHAAPMQPRSRCYSEVIAEIVGQFHESHPTRRLGAFVGPDTEALADRVAAGSEFYSERLQHVERAFAICADRGQAIDHAAVEHVIETARGRGTRPLLGQALRVRGMQRGRAEDLREALAVFETIGAVPYLARVQIELGRLVDDAALVERGIARLQELGDIGQLGRIGRPARLTRPPARPTRPPARPTRPPARPTRPPARPTRPPARLTVHRGTRSASLDDPATADPAISRRVAPMTPKS